MIVESRTSETLFVRNEEYSDNAYISIIPWNDPHNPNGFQLVIGSGYGSWSCGWPRGNNPSSNPKEFLAMQDYGYIASYLKTKRIDKNLDLFFLRIWPIFINHIKTLQ